MSAAKMALEKERLALQSKAKFDSTRHQHKTEDPDAGLMVRSIGLCHTLLIHLNLSGLAQVLDL